MVEVIQAIGIAYLAVMLYMSFVYYKRNNYSLRSFLFWAVVWVVGVLLLIMPETSSLITQRFAVARVLDFYLIMGLMFFSVVSFLSFMAAKRTEIRVEELVRQLALQKKRK